MVGRVHERVLLEVENRVVRVLPLQPERADIVYKRIVGKEGLEPPRYLSRKTTFPTQEDAEPNADSTGLDALVKSWGLLTADDRRRIIAIVNGRLA